MDVSQNQFATWFNSFILFIFFSAVPLLSIISGYLFFNFNRSDAWEAITKRMKRRFVSLYIPLILWNSLYLVCFYALFIYNPDNALFTTSKRLSLNFSMAGWMDYINYIFAITTHPLAFQFWFVRDLFVTAMITPLLWPLIKHIPAIGTVILGYLWLDNSDALIFTRWDVPLFFYLGGVIRCNNLPLAISKKHTLFLTILYIILAGLRAAAPLLVEFSPESPPKWLYIATNLLRLPGLLACWGIFSLLKNQYIGRKLLPISSTAFFIYAAHWPLFAVIKSVLWKVMAGSSTLHLMVHYFTSVTLTLTICLAAALTAARLTPRIFSLMNGGRNL